MGEHTISFINILSKYEHDLPLEFHTDRQPNLLFWCLDRHNWGVFWRVKVTEQEAPIFTLVLSCQIWSRTLESHPWSIRMFLMWLTFRDECLKVRKFGCSGLNPERPNPERPNPWTSKPRTSKPRTSKPRTSKNKNWFERTPNVQKWTPNVQTPNVQK